MAKKTTQPLDMTTTQLAQKLGLTQSAVLGLITRGRFPNVRKLPGKTTTYLIPYSDYEAYLVYRTKRNKKHSHATDEKNDE
jgi:predicted DNA-binding transcriptional regulator AlpA